VDDEADSRDLVEFILSAAGAIATTVPSAQDALLQLGTSNFDLLISDIGMPEVDGYTLMHQIQHAGKGNIPAIALTAYAGEVNHQQALASGFQKHLAKPVEPGDLIAAVLELVKGG
jgi:CheY-like chemotaxis protein